MGKEQHIDFEDLADMNLDVLDKIRTNTRKLERDITKSTQYSEPNLGTSKKIKRLEKLKKNAQMGGEIMKIMKKTTRSVGDLRGVNLDIRKEKAKLYEILRDKDTKGTLQKTEKIKRLQQLGLDIGIRVKDIALDQHNNSMIAFAEPELEKNDQDQIITRPVQEGFNWKDLDFLALIRAGIKMYDLGMKIFDEMGPIFSELKVALGGRDDSSDSPSWDDDYVSGSDQPSNKPVVNPSDPILPTIDDPILPVDTDLDPDDSDADTLRSDDVGIIIPPDSFDSDYEDDDDDYVDDYYDDDAITSNDSTSWVNINPTPEPPPDF